MNTQTPDGEVRSLRVALLHQYYRRGKILAEVRRRLPDHFVMLLVSSGMTETDAAVYIELYDRWDDLLGARQCYSDGLPPGDPKQALDLITLWVHRGRPTNRALDRREF